MNVDKSGVDDARWQLLRCLYAGQTDVLPLGAEELALIGNLPLEQVMDRIANWVIDGEAGHKRAFEALNDMRQQGGTLAREALELITGELEGLKRADPASLGSEARLKALLGLSKAFQALEDGLNRMEKSIQDDERYPGDILEFRAELERYLEALAEDENNPRDAGGADATPDRGAA